MDQPSNHVPISFYTGCGEGIGIMPFVISKDILYEEIDRELLVLDVKTNVPYVLNEMAAVVFKMMRNQTDAIGIAREICRSFDVTSEKALEDVRCFQEDLLQKGVLEMSGLSNAG